MKENKEWKRCKVCFKPLEKTYGGFCYPHYKHLTPEQKSSENGWERLNETVFKTK